MPNWAAELRLGIPAVDEDHANIVQLINELDEAIASRRPRDQVGIVMNDILTAASEHFCREEQFMRRIRFAGLVQHKHEHDELLRELRLATRAVAAGRRPADSGLVDWLHGWMVDHVNTSDRAIAVACREEALLTA